MWSKTNGIGFLFVLYLTLLSIDDMLNWVWHLSYPKWMNVICSVFVFISPNDEIFFSRKWAS